MFLVEKCMHNSNRFSGLISNQPFSTDMVTKPVYQANITPRVPLSFSATKQLIKKLHKATKTTSNLNIFADYVGSKIIISYESEPDCFTRLTNSQTYKLILNSLTWLPVELHIKVTLRAVFHPHCDQSPGDLKCRESIKELSRKKIIRLSSL